MGATGEHARKPPVCERCGDRIGVYEPVFVERDDGKIAQAALLDLSPAYLEGRRMWHASCRVEAPR